MGKGIEKVASCELRVASEAEQAVASTPPPRNGQLAIRNYSPLSANRARAGGGGRFSHARLTAEGGLDGIIYRGGRRGRRGQMRRNEFE
jgi:hypothetical protein